MHPFALSAKKASACVFLFYGLMFRPGIFYQLVLEMRWGIRWWDYEGHFMNVNGRICLIGALAFGLGGEVLVCFFLPLYEKIMKKIPKRIRLWVSIALILLFVADAAYAAMRPNTGYGITVGD